MRILEWWSYSLQACEGFLITTNSSYDTGVWWTNWQNYCVAVYSCLCSFTIFTHGHVIITMIKWRDCVCDANYCGTPLWTIYYYHLWCTFVNYYQTIYGLCLGDKVPTVFVACLLCHPTDSDEAWVLLSLNSVLNWFRFSVWWLWQRITDWLAGTTVTDTTRKRQRKREMHRRWTLWWCIWYVCVNNCVLSTWCLWTAILWRLVMVSYWLLVGTWLRDVTKQYNVVPAKLWRYCEARWATDSLTLTDNNSSQAWRLRLTAEHLGLMVLHLSVKLLSLTNWSADTYLHVTIRSSVCLCLFVHRMAQKVCSCISFSRTVGEYL